jgi:TPR repeat protein
MISNTEGIKDVFIQLEKHGGNADKVVVHATGHDKMAQLWKDNPLLKETLPILALLHPVGPVDLDTLRSIIISRAPEFEALTERGKLHGKLEDVRHQLSGYVSSNYLLENDGFVQFLLGGGFHWVDSDWKKEQLNILRHFHGHIENHEERYSKLLKQVVSSPWSGQITRAELETALGSTETSPGHINAMNKMLRRLPEQYRDQDLIGVLCSVAIPIEGDYLRDPVASVPPEHAALKLPEEKVLNSLLPLALTMLNYPKLQVTAVRTLKLLAGIGNIEAMFFLGNSLLDGDGDGFEKDLEEGRSWLRKAAEAEDPQAMFFLGFRLGNGLGFEKDPEEAGSWLGKAAQAEDPQAMFFLGHFLLEGNGSKKHLEEGRSWLRKAAEAEYPQAMFFLGERLLEGRGFEQDLEEGRSWLRKAAETEDPQAMRLLGVRLLEGNGFEKDLEEGRSWLRKAAETEDPQAMFLLGERLLDGDGFEQDLEEGRSWLRKAAEAEEPIAMRNLGTRLLEGDGFEQDLEEGRSWLRRAAEAEEPIAMRFLGHRLLEGNGFEQDLEEGRSWLRKVAEAEEPIAMRFLSNRLLEGDGFEKDLEEGRSWLRKAAEAEDPEAMRILGNRLLEGDGFEKDLEEGRSWLRKAAEAEEPYAMQNLGFRLLEGDGVEQDLEEGRSWLRKAAETEGPQAMRLLGVRLLEGRGFEKDLEEGRSWLRKAAETEDPQAMFLLGERLLEGRGFEQDLEEGQSWLRKAEEAGDVDAKWLLNNLVEKNLPQPGPARQIALGDKDPRKHILKMARLWASSPTSTTKLQSEVDTLQKLDRDNSNYAGLVAAAIRCYQHLEAEGDLLAVQYRYIGIIFLILNHLFRDDHRSNVYYCARRGYLAPPLPVELPDMKGWGVDPETGSPDDPIWAMNISLAELAGGTFTDEAAGHLQKTENLVKVVNWSHQRACKGDAEGHLVLGWLQQLGLQQDPDGWSTRRRLEMARELGSPHADRLLSHYKL